MLPLAWHALRVWLSLVPPAVRGSSHTSAGSPGSAWASSASAETHSLGSGMWSLGYVLALPGGGYEDPWQRKDVCASVSSLVNGDKTVKTIVPFFLDSFSCYQSVKHHRDIPGY